MTEQEKNDFVLHSRKLVQQTIDDCRSLIVKNMGLLGDTGDFNKAYFIGRVVNALWFSAYQDAVITTIRNFESPTPEGEREGE